MGPPSRPGTRARRRPVRSVLCLALASVATVGGCRTTDVDSADVAAEAMRVAATATAPSVPATGPPATTRPGTSPGTASAPETTTTAEPGDRSAEEAEIRATIDRFWDAWFEATSTAPANPDHPALKNVLAGSALPDIQSAVVQLRDKGAIGRHAPNSQFSRELIDIAIESDVALVVECVVDDLLQVSAADGTILNDEVATAMITYVLGHFDGKWMIVNYEHGANMPGVVPCV